MFFFSNPLKQKKLSSIRALWLVVLAVFLAGCSEGDDQTVPDFAIAYVKRPLQLETETVTVMVAGVQTDVDIMVPVDPDIREATDFNEGGDIYLRERASTNADERNITLCITDLDGDGIGTGDVRDLETNYAGTRLIFSLRLEDLTNGDNVPKWNIYEYDAEAGGCPTQVMPLTTFDADKGDDVAPNYLPDGRIIYSSNSAVTTRESLLNEGKSQFSPFDEDLGEAAVVLHVMNSDGSSIKQISFNQSHDMDASVLSSGEIVFSRWDGARNRSAIRLYTIHPDGTELKALYGLHDADVGTDGDTVQFMDPRELSNGRVLAMLKPFTTATPFNRMVGSGVPVEISVANYTDINQPTVPNLGILAGSGQVLAINQDVRTNNSVSPAGRYRSVYPLGDGSDRALVSWSQCRLQPTDAQGLPDLTELPMPCPNTIVAGDVEAFPLYGIYVYDFAQDTQLPVVIPSEGTVVDEPVVLAPRPRPALLLDKVAGLELDQALAEDEFVGILHIRSVYDFDGNFNALGGMNSMGAITSLADMADPTQTTADQRPARFLRIIKGAAIPDPQDDNNGFDAGVAFGAGGRRGGMREIIGYAPIEPDGSVMVKVPANVPLSFHVVDSSGRRITAAGRHLNWIQVRGGETLECGGCHTHTTTAPALPIPHGYTDAPTVLNGGAPTTPYDFPGTIVDNFAAQMDETMAQARIRVSCTNTNGVFLTNQLGCPELSPNVSPVFFDQWADVGIAVADDTSMRYSQLDPSMAAAVPVSASCVTTWDFTCRTIINYEDSIHPIWSVPRTDAATMVLDYTCTACHSNQDVLLSVPMVPMAQLDLSGGLRQDNPDRFKSYQELLIQDDVQWMLDAGGALAPVTEEVQLVVDGVPQFQMIDDGMGNLILELDINGDPIPILVTQNVPPTESPTMSVNGAFSSPNFFNRFTTPGMGTFEHAGLLTSAELRLLYEWLDNGGQYFNNTFDPRILN